MSKVTKYELEKIQQDQQKYPFKSDFFPDLDSVFITNQRTPYCNLLILGDYESADFSKKKALLDTSEKIKLNDSTSKNEANLVGELDGVTLFISHFSYYEKHTAFPAYTGATMTVIVPNSDEDLRVCFNSVYKRPHKPAKDSKVVYINLFDPKSDEYQAIELKAKELNFSDNKLVLEPVSFDRLVDIALQHTKEVFNRLTQPKKSIESHSKPEQSSPTSTSCTIL